MEIVLIICALVFAGGIVIGLTLNILWLALALVAYFVPTIIAIYRKHPSALWIFIINLFLGATVIGWIFAALWAFDFDKVILDFIEYRKAKYAKDAQKNTTIEDEVVLEDNNS